MIRRIALAGLAAVSSLGNAALAEAGELLRVEGYLMRWAPEAAGGKTIITYSVLQGSYHVKTRKSILSPSNCAKMHAFSDIVAKSPDLTEEKAKDELQAALRRWESVANIAFIEMNDPSLANIVIGAADDPGGRAFANLSYRGEKASHPSRWRSASRTPAPRRPWMIMAATAPSC